MDTIGHGNFLIQKEKVADLKISDYVWMATVSFLKGGNTKRANVIASEGCSKDMNSSFGGKFQWLFDRGKGNSVWVRKGFELSE